LLLAGVIGAVWPGLKASYDTGKAYVFHGVRMITVAAVLVAGGIVVAPAWFNQVQLALSREDYNRYTEALDWIYKNVPKDAVIAVDGNMWIDLTEAGYTNVVWFYKLDLDPEVSQKYIPNGYKDIDYVALRQVYYYIARDGADNSVIAQAEKHSDLVAQIGDPGDYSSITLTGLYNIRKVNQE
jgi:hypothetical protein